MNPPSRDAQAMDRLLDLMARLRAPDGCPWDREQTPASLKPQLLEECYEVLEAIDGGSAEHLAEELGDLLLHVVFQAQIAREAGRFTFAEVAEGIAEKLVRRHPHVFGEAKVADAAGTIELWQKLKKQEKPERQGALDGVPRALPALMRAEALQKKARHVGFDWPGLDGAVAKLREELDEVDAEAKALGRAADAAGREKIRTALAAELGDLLFSLVNVARHLKLDAEGLLTEASDKFCSRFREMERRAGSAGRALPEMSMPELDRLWNEAKAAERT